MAAVCQECWVGINVHGDAHLFNLGSALSGGELVERGAELGEDFGRLDELSVVERGMRTRLP